MLLFYNLSYCSDARPISFAIPIDFIEYPSAIVGTHVEYAEITECVLAPINISHFDITYRI